MADSESVSRIERNKSTILSAVDGRFAGRDILLQGPIASPLIGLALPILIVLAVQTLVSVAEHILSASSVTMQHVAAAPAPPTAMAI